MSQTSLHHDVFPSFITFIASDNPTPLSEMTSAPPFPKDAPSFDKARVIIDGHMITVAIDGDDGPRIIFRDAIDPNSFQKAANRSEDSRISTVSGKKIVYRKNDACGCGSRLKSWNPYNTLRSTADPTE